MEITEHFDDIYYLPWTSKQKYNFLAKHYEKHNVQEHFRAELVRNLLSGLEKPHLIPSIAILFNILLTKQMNDVLFDNILAQLKTEYNVVQTNIFKYLFKDYMKSNDGIVIELLEHLYPVHDQSFVHLHPVHTQPFVYSYLKLKAQILDRNTTEYSSGLDSILECTLKHINEDVRLVSFELLTYNLNEKTLKNVEYFLLENSSTDNSGFRNNIINLYENVLFKVQDKIYKHYKSGFSLFLFEHFEWLYNFVTRGLKCNIYQTVRMSLEILDMLLRYFNAELLDENKKCGVIRKKHQLSKSLVIKTILKQFKVWKFHDPPLQCALLRLVETGNSLDLSEKASRILIKYFHGVSDFTHIHDDCLNRLTQTKYFYEAESTALMMEISIRKSSQTSPKDRLIHLIDRVEVNSKSLLTNLTNNELYTYLLLLSKFTSDLSADESLKLFRLSEEIVKNLLDMFKFERTQSVPSFADMSLRLNDLIDGNDHDDPDDPEALLLNNIWLIIKRACEIICYLARNDERFEAGAMQLLVEVLMSNRHKGVIEAAGKEVLLLTRYLTTEGNAQIVDQELEKILTTFKNYNGSSRTRRTAGLCILFDKMLLGDKRKDSPTIHRTIKEFLELLDKNNAERIVRDDIDSRQSVVLHCLKPLVHDAHLYAITSTYLMDILVVCFENMSSDDWSIRNASLLLYGALLTKLLGQNDDTTIEDLYTKHPDVLTYVTNLLDSQTESSSQSTCFELLSLFSQTTVAFNTCNDDTLKSIIYRLKTSTWKLLGHSNYHMRKLAAKTYARLTCLKNLKNHITFMIDEIDRVGRVNRVHGLILSVSFMNDRLKHSKIDELNDDFILQQVGSLAKVKCKVGSPQFVFLEIEKLLPYSKMDEENLMEMMDSDSVWTSNETIKIYLDRIVKNDLETFLNDFGDKFHASCLSLINQKFIEYFCHALLEANISNLPNVFEYLFRFYEKVDYSIQKTIENTIVNLSISSSCEILEQNIFLPKTTHVPLMCVLLQFKIDNINLKLTYEKIISDFLMEKCLPHVDESERKQTVDSLRILVNGQYSGLIEVENGLMSVSFALFHLLRDENELIRRLTCECMGNLVNNIDMLGLRLFYTFKNGPEELSAQLKIIENFFKLEQLGLFEHVNINPSDKSALGLIRTFLYSNKISYKTTDLYPNLIEDQTFQPYWNLIYLVNFLWPKIFIFHDWLRLVNQIIKHCLENDVKTRNLFTHENLYCKIDVFIIEMLVNGLAKFPAL